MKGILVQKVNSEPGDSTKNGVFGRAVLFGNTPEEAKLQFPDIEKMYVIVWSNKPNLAIATVDIKLDIIDSVAYEFEISSSAKEMVGQLKEIFPMFNYF